MPQNYFKYEETTRQYIYTEQSVEYRMPLSIMLKFKRFSREHSGIDASIKSWLRSLTESEMREISIVKELRLT
ncbi:MAG TPA: hypothetical protein VF623_07835 [Segetibacter sp.]|jgi:hypothetical protein